MNVHGSFDAERLSSMGDEAGWLRSAIDQHSIVATTDRDGTIIEANDFFCAISGYSREELIGQTHRIINSGFHSQEFWKSLWGTILGGEVWRGQICNRAKSGSLYWVESTIFPCKDSTGAIVKFLAIRTDITARKRAEEEILRSRKLLADILDAASEVSIIATDPDGTISLFNRGSEQMLGYTAQEVVGRVTPAIIHSSREVEERGGELSREMGYPVEGFRVFVTKPEIAGAERREWTYVRKDGSTLRVSLAVTAIRSSDGRILGYLGVAQDITELKQAERVLAQARDQAIEASRLKSEFLANMSHEIRTPMNGIIGMNDLLLDTSLTPEQRACAETVQASAQSLLTLINDILDLSKIEAGKLELEQVEFDLEELVKESVSLLAVSARNKGLAFSTAISPDVPRRLAGDPARLRQILINLAGNAIKFTAEGRVSLSATAEEIAGSRITIRFDVSDTGIGIEAGKLGSLFQNFTQVDASMTRKFGGTGLGLSISRQLVEMMGGTIRVRSVPGEGSTFTFTVVFQRPSGPSRARAPHMEAPGGFSDAFSAEFKASQPQGAMILLVEDNSINQRVVLGRLAKLGLKADTVEDGTSALKALERRRYHLVLMDVQMPVMDGYAVTRAARDPASRVLDHAVPIVAITAGAMQGDRERCLEAGMDDYLSKPLREAELVAALKKWLPPGSWELPVSSAPAG